MIRYIWSEVKVPLQCMVFILSALAVLGVSAKAIGKYNESNNASIAMKYVEMHPSLKNTYDTMLIGGICNMRLAELEGMALKLSLEKGNQK